MLICRNDGFCPRADEFENVEEFLEMCRAVMGEEPQLHRDPATGHYYLGDDCAGELVLEQR